MLTTSRLHLLGPLVIAAAGLTQAFSGGLATAQTLSGYTVTLEEVLTTRNGASSVVSVETHALRPDGTTVLQLGHPGETARHIRMPSGVLIDTNDKNKRMSTFHVSPKPTAVARDSRAKCRRDAEELLAEETVGGYRAAKIVGANGGAIRWYALDHSCALLRSVMQHPDGSRSEKFLVSLVAGPPSEALFQTDGYVEGLPSALADVTSCDAACERWRKRRDADYHRLRPR